MNDLTHDTFDAAVKRDALALVDFWAPWCGPCKMLEPALKKVEAETCGRLAVYKVDIGEEKALADAWQVKTTPTFVLLRDGREVDRKAGGIPGAVLRRWALDAAEAD